MSKLLKTFLILNLFFISYAQISIMPHYSLSFTQGGYIPSRGEAGLSSFITNDIGVITKLSDRHTLLGLYELKYTGPGLKRLEGEKFEFRYLIHTFVLQHNYSIMKDMILKSRLLAAREFTRTGADEAWGFGLYDTNKYGVSFEIERKKFAVFDTPKATFRINYLEYPNYTDLLEEFLAGAEEVTAGKQNNIICNLGFSGEYRNNKFTVDFIIQQFINQNVIEKTGTYGTEKQRDLTFSLNLQSEQIVKPFSISPTFSYRYKDSNQGYLHFTVFPSTPTPLMNYYDYHRIGLSIPFTLLLTKRSLFNISPEFEFTFYTARPPRNENNEFMLDKKQHNQLFTITLSYVLKSQITNFTLFYTYQTQSSNMKFERYFPYNYSGHAVGLNLIFSY